VKLCQVRTSAHLTAEGTEPLTLRTRWLAPSSHASLYAKVQPNGEPLAQFETCQLALPGPPEPSKPSKKLVACAAGAQEAASASTVTSCRMLSPVLSVERIDQGMSETLPATTSWLPAPAASLMTSMA